MATQLIQPNYAINEVAGLCLQYARRTYNLPAVEPTAYAAYKNLKYFHADRNFPNASVPVWFEWYGDLGGGRQRYDHVAVRDANGTVWSSPLTGTGRAAFSSVDKLIQAFGNGMKYLGWSEDISGTRVVNVGGEMITREQYMQAAEAAGFMWGKDFNYDPNKSLDEFVQMLWAYSPVITKEMENAVADGISGVKNYIGWDGYNSQFVGQKVVSHYQLMVEFWIANKGTARAVAQIDRTGVIDYINKNLK